MKSTSFLTGLVAAVAGVAAAAAAGPLADRAAPRSFSLVSVSSDARLNGRVVATQRDSATSTSPLDMILDAAGATAHQVQGYLQYGMLYFLKPTYSGKSTGSTLVADLGAADNGGVVPDFATAMIGDWEHEDAVFSGWSVTKDTKTGVSYLASKNEAGKPGVFFACQRGLDDDQSFPEYEQLYVGFGGSPSDTACSSIMVKVKYL